MIGCAKFMFGITSTSVPNQKNACCTASSVESNFNVGSILPPATQHPLLYCIA